MKGLTLHIAVFVLLLALFFMVALTSSWPDKCADNQVSHLSDNARAPIPQSVMAVHNAADRLGGNDEGEPELEAERGLVAASISYPSDDPGRPKPKGGSAHGRTNDLGEDEDSTDGKDDFVYTDDVVE